MDSETFFSFIVERVYDGIAVLDESLRILYANTQFANILRYPKMDLIGQDFRSFIAKESRPIFALEELLKEVGRQKPDGVEKIPAQFELIMAAKDGARRTVDVRTVTFWNVHGKIRTLTQMRDITEVKRLEAERNLFERRLSELNRYAQKLNMAEDLKEICKITLDAMRHTLGFEYASFFILEGEKLRMLGQSGSSEPARLVLPMSGNVGISVRAAKTGEAVVVPDVRLDPSYVKGNDGMLSELAVPMKVGDRVIGVLNVESSKLNAFNENDQQLLEILASHAAIAISNVKKREKLSTINAYGRSLSKAKTMKEILEITLRAVQEILEFSHADIFLIEDEKLKLATTTAVPSHIVGEIEIRLTENRSVVARAAREQTTIYVPDTRNDDGYLKIGDEVFLSELSVPIKIGASVLGVLNVESKRPAAFDEEDIKQAEILASYVAVAISNVRKQESLTVLSRRLEYLVKSCTRLMQISSIRGRIRAIAEILRRFGWRNAVVILLDEGLKCRELITSGLTKDQKAVLAEVGINGELFKIFFTPEFEKYRIGEFHYMPFRDPLFRQKIREVQNAFQGIPVDKMLEYHSADMLLAPLRTPEGKLIGIISLADPIGKLNFTPETLIPLALFLRPAALAIENAQLIDSLEKAREELKEHAEQLEQKVMERTRALVEFQDKLLKAQRMAVIGELAGMVGHDLRNPLTGMATAAYYLKKRLANVADSKIMEMIQIIEKNIAYSNKIINDLLEYSREIKLDLSQTTPKALIDDALSTVEIPAGIQLVNRTSEEPRFIVDFDKMKRVFINLIKNAIDAMPNGGTLTVKSSVKEDMVVFKVSDTGVGMSEEVMKRLWTPLFTTKAKGMGFGLAICKRFIEAHGGTVSVKSALGKGTTFTVILPIQPKTREKMEEEGGENVWVKSQESSLLTTTKT
ncbi:MAG: GAF domain-containing protein [Candidatus Bathyarchaeota archaeon]|nr:GAF domain-containing protein [Candidatus Bathyarchaeota archaeon]